MKSKILFFSVLFLTACFAGNTKETTFDSIRAARSGLRISTEFIILANAEEIIPAILAGAQYSTKLSGALKVDYAIPKSIPSGSTTNSLNEDTDLLAEFVQLMKTDVEKMLNQSTNREGKIDEYAKSLQTHVQQGSIRFRSLEDKESALNDDKSRLSRRVRSLENELDTAIAKGDSTSATMFTTELIEKQTQLAQADADLRITKRIIASYEDLIEPMKERLNAINANRNALIQGVRVIDIPGVEDLGILQVGEDGIPTFTGRRRSFF